MSRLGFWVSIVLLWVGAAGCGDSTPSTDSARVQPNESTGDTPSVDEDSQPTSESVDSQPDPAQSTNTTATESATLKQAMINVAAAVMKEQQPEIGRDAVLTQVENAIAEIREDVPDFLMVSAETEQRLQAGTPVEGAAERIAAAEAFLKEYEIPLTGIVTTLLPKHEAGNLDPVRTELLAHLIVADMKKAQDALIN